MLYMYHKVIANFSVVYDFLPQFFTQAFKTGKNDLKKEID